MSHGNRLSLRTAKGIDVISSPFSQSSREKNIHRGCPKLPAQIAIRPSS